MFGIDDPGIWIAYLGVFASVIFAVFFGVKNWNRGDENDPEKVDEDIKWEQKDDEIKHDIAN